MEVSQAVPQLTEDQIDDLIYFARVNDLDELRNTFTELSAAHGCTPAAVLQAAVEEGSGNTPLHMAAANGHEETLQYLLELCSSAPQPATSTTGLPTSSENGAPVPSSSSSSSPPQQPSTINCTNSSGNTALHWAAVNGHAGCARLLVGAGADISVENAAKHDALDEAERAGRTAVVRVLLARMSGKSESEIVEEGQEPPSQDEEGVVVSDGIEDGEVGAGGFKVNEPGDFETDGRGVGAADSGGVRVTQLQLQRLGLDEKVVAKGKSKDEG